INLNCLTKSRVLKKKLFELKENHRIQRIKKFNRHVFQAQINVCGLTWKKLRLSLILMYQKIFVQNLRK
ncbi:hypothetical protein BpHYR1_054341, partial [Brachionus plicatilis]